MIIKVSKLKKADVVTQDGKKMSSIQDILYDPTAKKVIALITSKKGVMSEGKLILTQQVQKISDQAVLVESKSAEIKQTEADPNIQTLMKDSTLTLSSGKIVDENARMFGSVSDVFLDADSKRVVGFETSQGMMKDMKEGKTTMKIEEIVSVGKDAIIVKPLFSEHTSNNTISNQQEEPEQPNNKLQDAVGKYVSKNILTDKDELLVKQGDIITHKMLEVASKLGLLDEILNNVTEKPIKSPQIVVA